MVVEQNSSGNPPASVSPDHSSLSFVQGVDLQLIASLATSVRQREFAGTASCTCTTDPNILKGSFNVIWIIKFSDKVKWILRTPIIPWTPMLEERLRSDMVVIKLIQSRTTIPIPKIHDFCFTSDNQLGRPYMIMDYAKGTRLKDVWFDPEWFTEDKRHTLFKSLASYISQLRVLQFDAIGSLYYDEISNTHSVGPLIPSQLDIIWDFVVKRGPYKSTHTYLLDVLTRKASKAPTDDHKASFAALRILSGLIPDDTLDGAPFVLAMPDFGCQNVFVDDAGCITAIIDWDGCNVMPRQGGYSCYPLWLMTDWDPSVFSDSPFPMEETTKGTMVRKDLAVDLQLYREEYLSAFMNFDPEGARYMEHSHIFKALELANEAHISTGIIEERLASYIFQNEVGLNEDISFFEIEEGIKDGLWVKKWLLL